MSEPAIATRLPENAYRELKPGEAYTPMVPAGVSVPEVTTRSIVFGIVMNIIFSAAATYLALKVGQGIETAIPISILSVGLSGFMLRMGARRSSLLENVNILAISTTSGIVAGGTVFTMPAIYILGLNKNLGMSNVQLFFQIMLVPFLGAVLGVIFLVPFRNYFVRVMHGKLPFPEATATNEILATGAAGGGDQAAVLIKSFFAAVAYNFLSVGCRIFSKEFTTGVLEVGAGKEAREIDAIGMLHTLTHKIKAVFSLETSAAFLGLGFIIGLKYATIICCGSFISCFVFVPLLGQFDLPQLKSLNAAVTGTSAAEIWKGIPRVIGIGGIFAAGILSILKMGKVIVTALTQAIGGLIKRDEAGATNERTEQDINYPMLMLIGAATAIVLFIYLKTVVLAGIAGSTQLALIATALALLLGFLFTTVSAWAIAMISTTPLSGMTVTTVIITAVALLAAGLPKGDQGMLAVLLVGSVVCTCLSMAGTMVTEFKIGYWLGATPRRIQWSGILSALLASALVTLTIMVLAEKPGYIKTELTPDPLSAPQANMIKSALESFVGTSGQVPWTLYAIGAVLTLVVNFLGISPLAFMLGMYLPMGINTPILLGAIVADRVSKGSSDERVNKARSDKGILVASGLIAGAAIIDVLLNGLAILDEKAFKGAVMPALAFGQRLFGSAETAARAQNWLGLAAFVVLCWLVYADCRKAKVGETAGPSIGH